MLSQYRTYLHRSDKFQIPGCVDAVLAAAVAEELKEGQCRPPAQTSFLTGQRGAWKKESNKHDRAGDMLKAQLALSKAIDAVCRLRRYRAQWKQVSAAGGATFRNAIAEMYFLFWLNHTTNKLRVMRQSGPQTVLRELDKMKLEITEWRRADGTAWEQSKKTRTKARRIYLTVLAIRLLSIRIRCRGKYWMIENFQFYLNTHI